MANPKSTPAAFRSVLREVLGDAVYEHFPFKMRRVKFCKSWEARLPEQMIAATDVSNELGEVRDLFAERYGKLISFGLYEKFNGTGVWVVTIPMLDPEREMT